jgi:hypothetical protein
LIHTKYFCGKQFDISVVVSMVIVLELLRLWQVWQVWLYTCYTCHTCHAVPDMCDFADRLRHPYSAPTSSFWVQVVGLSGLMRILSTLAVGQQVMAFEPLGGRVLYASRHLLASFLFKQGILFDFQPLKADLETNVSFIPLDSTTNVSVRLSLPPPLDSN